jgi:hypothetical protein
MNKTNNPFENKPEANSLYEQLITKLLQLGPIEPEIKKTSVHVVIPGRSAFLGVHPRRDHLQLNIVLDHPLENLRALKVEQVSKNRYHNLVKVEKRADLDEELMGWLAEAYRAVEQKAAKP